MKKITLSFFLILAFGHFSQSQSFRSQKPGDPFRNTQAFIGLFGGTNFSQPIIASSYSDFSSIEGQANSLINDEKTYEGLTQNRGSHFGLSGVFSFNRFFSASLSPTYYSISYSYQSQYIWEEVENPQNYVFYDFKHQQQFRYLSLPFSIRYSPVGKRVRPYLQVGVHYDRLLDAQKSVTTTGLDRASGGEVNFSRSPQTTDTDHLYIKSHFGLMAGAGITYNLGTIAFFLDGQYRYGMHTITNAQTRYSGARDIPGFGNVMDDVSIRNLQVNLGCYFPLKFLTKEFEPVIL